MLIFKEAPRILFTGLTKAIGEPRDLDKNIESPDYFEKDINIEIPHDETAELKSVQRNLASAMTSAATSVQQPKPVAA